MIIRILNRRHINYGKNTQYNSFADSFVVARILSAYNLNNKLENNLLRNIDRLSYSDRFCDDIFYLQKDKIIYTYGVSSYNNDDQNVTEWSTLYIH